MSAASTSPQSAKAGRTVKAVVLRTAGTNCDGEAIHALTRAGAAVDMTGTLAQVRRLARRPARKGGLGFALT